MSTSFMRNDVCRRFRMPAFLHGKSFGSPKELRLSEVQPKSIISTVLPRAREISLKIFIVCFGDRRGEFGRIIAAMRSGRCGQSPSCRVRGRYKSILTLAPTTEQSTPTFFSTIARFHSVLVILFRSPYRVYESHAMAKLVDSSAKK